MNNRYDFIDLSRAFAIMFAMTSHIFLHTTIWSEHFNQQTFLLLKSITRTATPTFIVLFGIMLELVYCKSYQQSGAFGAVSQRLISRALICYLGMVFIAIFALITNKISLEKFWTAINYAGPGVYGEILKYYSIALLVAPVLVYIRCRYGLFSLSLMIIAVWLLSPWLHALFQGKQDVHYMFSYLFGIGNKVGPTMDKGLTFIIYGMLLGNLIHQYQRGKQQLLDYLLPAIILIFSSIFVLFSLFNIGFADFFIGITGYQLPRELQFRRANMAEYYTYGIAAATLSLVLCAALLKYIPRLSQSMFLSYGKNSLFAYTFGNALINLMPFPPDSAGTLTRLLLSLLFMVFLLLATHYQLNQKLFIRHNSNARWEYRPIAFLLDKVQNLCDAISSALIRCLLLNNARNT